MEPSNDTNRRPPVGQRPPSVHPRIRGGAGCDSGPGRRGVVLSLKAVLIGLLYNWVFDRLDARMGRVSSDRSTLGRALHAIGFEFSLVTTSLPIYLWWLNLTLLEAVLMDAVITTFVVVYTYVFTLAYDRLFPVRRALACSAV